MPYIVEKLTNPLHAQATLLKVPKEFESTVGTNTPMDVIEETGWTKIWTLSFPEQRCWRVSRIPLNGLNHCHLTVVPEQVAEEEGLEFLL